MLAAALPAVLLACASTPPSPPGTAPDAPVPAEAPWAGAHIPIDAAAQPYVTAWTAAENRSTCSLIAFVESEATQGATPRVATFSGGWGVAYDRPGVRSAFGIAGTGVNASDPAYHEWPHRLSWSDGSSAAYGPEGGTGPNQLAYLTIAGEQCLYNVWSRSGRAHLEALIDAIRFVETRS